MHSDPIADMLTRIRNAQKVKRATVSVNYSKLNLSILYLLLENRYLAEVKQDGQQIIVTLCYDKGKQPKIRQLRRISKPGQRVYVSAAKLPRVLNDYGLAIISTSKKLITNKTARAIKVGGEVICEIY